MKGHDLIISMGGALVGIIVYLSVRAALSSAALVGPIVLFVASGAAGIVGAVIGSTVLAVLITRSSKR